MLVKTTFNPLLIQRIAGVLISCFLISCSSTTGTKETALDEKERPNVIFLVVDDLNQFGFETSKIKTPAFDRLRDGSVYFRSANCAAPVCIPSRAAFFTGIYPHKSGVYLNGGDPWNDSEALKNAETMPELFKRSGYYTYGRGKIYHKDLEEGRIEKNFDNRPIYQGGFEPFPDKDHRVASEKDKFPKFWGVQSFADSLFPDVINTNAVMDFLKEDHDKPFFITLGLWRPHTPFTAPQRFFDLYNPDEIEIPEGYKADDLNDIPEFAKALLDPFGRFEVTGAKNVDRWKHFIHGYYAATSFVDWNVGRVLESLEKSKYADNTIFILLSDNGFHLGAKDHWEKNTLWDLSAITPLTIKMPEMKSGWSVESPVGLIDLFPTLVDVCQLEQPVQTLDGTSLRNFLEDRKYSSDRPALTTFGENIASLRSKQYRYIEYPDGSSELYNIEKDPFEWNNLSGDSEYDSIISNFKKYLPKEYATELPGRRN